jgi:hypothetical protein
MRRAVSEAIKTSTAAGQRSDRSAKRSAKDISHDRHESRANAMHEAIILQ